MGAPAGTDVEALKAENEKLKERVAQLEAKLEAQVRGRPPAPCPVPRPPPCALASDRGAGPCLPGPGLRRCRDARAAPLTAQEEEEEEEAQAEGN